MKKTLVALGLVAVMLVGVSYTYARGPGLDLARDRAPGPEPGREIALDAGEH